MCLSYNEFSSEIISNNLNIENSTRPPSVLFNWKSFGQQRNTKSYMAPWRDFSFQRSFTI